MFAYTKKIPLYFCVSVVGNISSSLFECAYNQPISFQVKLIKNYKADVDSLDDAERFYHRLISIPDYRFRIEAMLQREEGPLLIKELTPQIDRIKSVCHILMSDTNLVEFLGIILKLGNLVNSVSVSDFASSCVGFVSLDKKQEGAKISRY